VGQQHAIVEDRAPDPGAQRDHGDHALAVLAGAEAHLGEAGGVSVIEHRDRTPESVGAELVAVEVDQPLSMLAAVWTTPLMTTPGNVIPIGPSTSGKWATICSTTLPTSVGFDFLGVSIR